jgi:hypothetical protein
MRRVPIRLKLAAALAVPLLAMFLRTSLEIVDESRHVADLEDQARLARMAVGPGGLINRMQDERTWTVVDGSGADGPGLALNAPVEHYDEARRLTDEALADLRAEVAKDSRVEAIFAPALGGFDALAASAPTSTPTAPPRSTAPAATRPTPRASSSAMWRWSARSSTPPTR